MLAFKDTPCAFRDLSNKIITKTARGAASDLRLESDLSRWYALNWDLCFTTDLETVQFWTRARNRLWCMQTVKLAFLFLLRSSRRLYMIFFRCIPSIMCTFITFLMCAVLNWCRTGFAVQKSQLQENRCRVPQNLMILFRMMLSFLERS